MEEEREIRRIMVLVPKETHRTLRVEAAKRDTSIQKLAERCLAQCAQKLAAETEPPRQ